MFLFILFVSSSLILSDITSFCSWNVCYFHVLPLFRSSPFISFGSCTHCNLTSLFDLVISRILFQPWHTLLQFVITYSLFGWHFGILSNRFSSTASKFSKPADSFNISPRYCSPPATSFNFLRWNFSVRNLCAVCILTGIPSPVFATIP
jgi:hypothetical protein